MNVPNYIFNMPWYRNLSPYGKVLLVDAIRMAHLQYGGQDIDLTERRGITLVRTQSCSGLSPGLFLKARKELLRNGILSAMKDEKTGVRRRDVYMFGLPS